MRDFNIEFNKLKEKEHIDKLNAEKILRR